MILKQRDIMVALSEKLNERDQVIDDLKEEMRAYDQYSFGLEQKLQNLEENNEKGENDQKLQKNGYGLQETAKNLIEKLKVSKSGEIQAIRNELCGLVVLLNKILL